MNKIIIIFSLFVGTANAFAGGSTVAGVGAPKIEYGCYEMDFKKGQTPSFQVTVGRFWPHYELELYISDRQNRLSESVPVERHISPEVGGALAYEGQKYTLTVSATSTPIFEDGEVYSHSRFYINGHFDRALKCQRRDSSQ